MTIKEKAAYVKGLFSGLDLDGDKKETKLFSAVIDLVQDMALSLEGLEEDVDDICDQLDIIDEDLAEVEDEVFDECDCDDKCDYDCDCGCHDEDFYEVVCPSCGEKICLEEDALLDRDMNCPGCGELLEFDFDDVKPCECGCDCEDDCDDDCDCGCGCGCDEEKKHK